MIEGGSIDDHETGKVVTVWGIVSVPCNDIVGGEILLSLEEATLVLGHNSVVNALFFECGDWEFKITRRGKTIGTWNGKEKSIRLCGLNSLKDEKRIRTNWAKIGKLKVSVVNFTHVTTAGTFREADGENDSSLDDANVVGGNFEVTKLSLDVQFSQLRNYCSGGRERKVWNQ